MYTDNTHKDASLPARFAPLALLVKTIAGTALFHTVPYNINIWILNTQHCEKSPNMQLQSTYKHAFNKVHAIKTYIN